ncbi:MAG: TolC family protein [bacterium]
MISPIRTEIDRVLDLESALNEAIAANLDLASKNREVAAGTKNISRARSNLLPQIDINATAFQVDKDRANASFGSLPERKFSGSVTLTQLIYSNDAWTNPGIQSALQKSLEQEHVQLRLDISQEAATAYFQVLRAKTNERIERENLQRKRKNLELARVREAVGYSGRADVYRWESEIATNRSRVITTNSQRNLAEIQLNRLLHRPSEEAFVTREIDIQDLEILRKQGPLLKYFESQGAFRTLREFLVHESFKNSPELHQFDALIAVQEKAFTSAKRAFWTPTVAVQAELENTFSKSANGQGGGDAPIIPGLETADDLNWTVALNLSFPLFTSGAKTADRDQAREELTQVKLRRESVAERIKQRVRSALHIAGASFAAIKLSQDAATAARQNLDLVVDAYSRGVLSIIDLIDAQNAALVAEQASANAVYTFIIDFVEVQRAVGMFHYFMTEQERDEILQRLRAFEEERGNN